MKMRGKTAKALKALRKKYHLGEFATTKKRKASSTTGSRKAKRASASRKYYLPFRKAGDAAVKGGSNLVYDINRTPVPVADQGGSNLPTVPHGGGDSPRPRPPVIPPDLHP